MTKYYLLFIALVFVFTFASPSAYACSCIPIKECYSGPYSACVKKQAVRGAVYGKVISITYPESNAGFNSPPPIQFKAELIVEESWNLRKYKRVFIIGEYNDGANCGTELRIGQRYLIYTRIKAGIGGASGCNIGLPGDIRFLKKNASDRKR